MRQLVAWLTALTFAVSPAIAGTSGNAEKSPSQPTKAAETSAPAAKTSSTAKTEAAPKPETSSLELELEQLRDLLQQQTQELQAQRAALREQQQKVQALESQLSMVKTSSGAPTSTVVVGTPSPASPTVVNVGTSPQPAAAAGTNGGLSRPADQERKSDSIVLANGKVRIGALFYGDYAFYYQTGFGPQFLTQINQPGPGNDRFNSFDLTRAYLNFYYMPSDAITLRITPNVFRQIGGATADKFGKVSAIGSSVDGNLSYRLKYAYVDFNKLFANSQTFGEDKLTIGVQQNPLIDWEETLYGFRWVNLVPWNYLSLSSSQTGFSLHGPVKFGGKQYIDYSVAGFTNANFHQFEQSEKKQVMARVSYYPFGASSQFQGLGITGFIDYGFTNVAPDSTSTPLYRAAGLVHYTSAKNGYGIGAEIDYGRNAFSSNNFFSGSGPQDQFAGLGVTPYAKFDALTKAIQDNNRTKQRGFAGFGHADIPGTKFTLFGMYEYFNPNRNVSENPLDFHRVVGGISYKYSPRLQFALDSQNVLFAHSQFTFPAAEIARFSPSLAKANPGGIPNAVPNNIQAIFLNVVFSF
jgi:hypothetical protein